MEKIVVLNHKMNMRYSEIKDYIKVLKKIDLDSIVFPTSIYAKDFVEHNIKTGIQNIYYKNEGPYTGEISSSQAKSLGIDYVLVGHQERREIFNETNEEINKKIKSALKEKLKVILCVGEKKANDYKKSIKKQIEEGLKDISEEVIIAYEPVWAIGTNETPSIEYIKNVVNYIKSLLNYDIIVLYGGSVDSAVVKELKEVNEVSGFLIGGNSTNISELNRIKEVVK